MKHYKYREYFRNIIPCLGYGLLCGSVVGAFIFAFKLLSKLLEENVRFVYAYAYTHPLLIPFLFAGLVVCALVMNILHKKIPEVKGGGIPRSEGILRGVLPFKWLKTLVGTFFGSLLSFFVGLPLGSEGPAVLIGTSVGGMVDNISKSKSAWGRCIMTGGAGAGFAVATGAPLSAILFTLEEIHKRISPMLVLMVSTSVLVSSYVNRLLCGMFDISPNLFEFVGLRELDMADVGYLVLLAVLVSSAVFVFDLAVELFNKLTKRFSGKLTHCVKLVIFFILTGILGLFFSDGIYSGHKVIEDIITKGEAVLVLVLILAVRLVMMLLATSSGATGGIFIPSLAIGALFSAIISNLLVVCGMSVELFPTFVVLGMCAFLGGTLRAPITAMLFFIEITGAFGSVFYGAIVVFVVNFIIEMFDRKPFYDRVLDSMEKTENKGKTLSVKYFEVKVSKGAFAIGKPVRDILWPHASVIVSIIRDGKDFSDTDNDGEKKLYEGDTLVIRARCYDDEEMKDYLHDLVGRGHDIKVTLKQGE